MQPSGTQACGLVFWPFPGLAGLFGSVSLFGLLFLVLTPSFTVYSPNLALNSTYSCLRLLGAGIKS